MAPTDPVSAIATFGRVGVPERVALLVEGESMVNDATALVAYRVLLGGVLAGSYQLGDVVSELTIGVAGGIAIGLAAGWLTAVSQRRLDDVPLAILLSVVAPFATFTVCEQVGASGVLSVVASGLYIGWRSHEIFDAETRLNAIAFWQAFVFALNAILFVLLGLQFPDIIERLEQNARRRSARRLRRRRQLRRDRDQDRLAIPPCRARQDDSGAVGVRYGRRLARAPDRRVERNARGGLACGGACAAPDAR